MSAKDDLEFVNEARVAVSRPMQPASTNEKFLVASSGDMNRLLSLAERGARFTKEHEAELKAWRVADDEALDPGADRPGWTSWRDHARRICALNEASEKENER